MPDEFLAMLQGMDPNQAQAMANKLRGKDLFGKVFGASLDPNAQRMGQGLSTEALGQTKSLGLARAKKAAQDQTAEMQSERWASTDAARDAQYAQSQRNWEERLAFDKTKLEEGNALKLALQEMKGQQRASTVNKEVQSMSKEFTKANVPQLESAFDDLSKILQPYLTEDGAIKDGIPGAGATGLIPAGMLTKEGKEVRSVIANVRNQVMKMMSGAAVTDPEAARLYEQIGQYLGGSDEDILFGLQGLKNIADRNRANIEAGFTDEALLEYGRRLGGRESPAAANYSTSAAEIVVGDAESYF